MRNVWILVKKDMRVAMNLRRLAQEQSVFKVLFILLFAGGLLLGLWALFLQGFRFLDMLGGVGLMLVSRLFSLFFLGLGVMLVISSVITAYTSTLGSDETAYLMLKPLTFGEITVYKLLQSAFYASWAFFFAIIPFIGAYARHEQLPPGFAFWTLFYSIPLVLLCAGVGMIVCLAVARWFPRSIVFRHVLLVVLAVSLWWFLHGLTRTARVQSDTTIVLSRLIPGLRVASNPLWPTWWVSEGILCVTRHQWGRGLMLWLALVTTTILVGMIAEWLGTAVFYDSWQRVRASGSRTVRRRTLLGFVEPLLRWIPSDVRAMIMKDVRIFLRDPAQWSQSLIFFGLLGLYFLNLRNLRYHMMPPEWRNLISFLNVFSVSSVLCSFGARFVFPQLSLEGHGFWIIGLAPTTMARILVAKFLVALAGMSVVSIGLMYISTLMLQVGWGIRVVAVGVAAAVSLAVSGLSTGLGALFIDLRQQNPSAIISGFGGTLNLVMSLAFMFAAIIPYGMVFHLQMSGRFGPGGFERAVALATVWLVLVTVAVTVIPLILGARSLMRREY